MYICIEKLKNGITAKLKAANKAGWLNELCTMSVSLWRFDLEDEQGFKMCVQQKLIQIALGQSKLERLVKTIIH